MNKNKKDLKRGQEKRVLHAIMPKVTWNKFDHWRIKMGFATTIEAIRFLIRYATEIKI